MPPPITGIENPPTECVPRCHFTTDNLLGEDRLTSLRRLARGAYDLGPWPLWINRLSQRGLTPSFARRKQRGR
jgi:hypothetical protein